MVGKLDSLLKRLQEEKAESSYLSSRLEDLQGDLETAETELECIEEARTLIQNVAQQIQSKLEEHLSSLTSMCLDSVLPHAPELVVRFEQRRGQTECDLFFKEFDTEYHPSSGTSGGGALDITSLGLRITAWGLQKTRPVFLLDEPFKYVSHDLQIKVSNLLHTLCSDLGIQIIMVSHQPDVNLAADRTFTVEKKGGMSSVSTSE